MLSFSFAQLWIMLSSQGSYDKWDAAVMGAGKKIDPLISVAEPGAGAVGTLTRYVHLGVGGDHDRPETPWLGIDAMVSRLPSEGEAVFLKNAREPFPMNGRETLFRLLGRACRCGAHGSRGRRELRSYRFACAVPCGQHWGAQQ